MDFDPQKYRNQCKNIQDKAGNQKLKEEKKNKSGPGAQRKEEMTKARKSQLKREIFKRKEWPSLSV